MSFPSSAPVDTFDRADSALRGSGIWASGSIDGSGIGGPDITSNEVLIQVADPAATAYIDRITTTTYTEVGAKLGGWSGSSVAEFQMYDTIGSSFSGYSVVFFGSNWEVREATGGSDTTIMSGSHTEQWDTGWVIGAKYTSRGVEVWANAPGLGPKLIACAGNTSHPGPHYAGFYLDSAAVEDTSFTDFYYSGIVGGGSQSFPVTNVLDDFNRANTGPPLSSQWTNETFSPSGGGRWKVSGNLAVQDSQFAESYFNTIQLGDNFEVYATLATPIAGAEVEVGVITVASAGSTSYNGYAANMRTTGCLLRKYTAGAQGTLVTLSSPVESTGDTIGIRRLNGIIQLWVVDEGCPTLLFSVEDTTHSGPFYPYLYADGGASFTVQFDNYGGGTLDTSLKYVRRAQVT